MTPYIAIPLSVSIATPFLAFLLHRYTKNISRLKAFFVACASVAIFTLLTTSLTLSRGYYPLYNTVNDYLNTLSNMSPILQFTKWLLENVSDFILVPTVIQCFFIQIIIPLELNKKNILTIALNNGLMMMLAHSFVLGSAIFVAISIVLTLFIQVGIDKGVFFTPSKKV